MTTILFVATSSNANSGGGRTRIVDIAREVQKRGLAAHIVCFVYATQWLSGPQALARGRARLSADAGCPVIYLPSLPFGRLAWVAWLNSWLAGLLLAWLAGRLGASLVFGHGAQAGHLGVCARALHPSLKIISDIQGAIVDEYLYERGASGPDVLSRRMEREEFNALSASDSLVFVSQAMRDHYQKRFSRSFPSSAIIPCAVRGGFALNWPQRQAARRAHGLEEKFVICYLGAAETYQLPAAMCRLFKSIRASLPNAFFLIYSFQAAVFERCLHAEEIPPDCYKITSAPHDQIFENLQVGDVGLLLRDSSPVNRVASPLKFGEYCLCGLPVITTPYVGDFSEIVIQSHLGAWIDPDSPTVTPGLLKFLQDVRQQREQYALRCADFAQKRLTWDVHGDTLAVLFNSLDART